jgi:hypothetical protein
MAKQPQREILSKALIAMGEKRVEGRSTKYMAFTRAGGGWISIITVTVAGTARQRGRVMIRILEGRPWRTTS